MGSSALRLTKEETQKRKNKKNYRCWLCWFWSFLVLKDVVVSLVVSVFSFLHCLWRKAAN